MMAIESSFAETEYSIDDLEGVILAGGSTRIDYVQKQLEKLVKMEPEMHKNPDETIALGAAFYSAKKHSSSLNPNQRAAVESLDLTEVANKNYGTFAVDETLGSYGKVNSVIISKDTNIPCSETRTYYTMSDENNYTIWSFLKKLFNRGKIYKGTDVVPWSGRSGTSYSQMEIIEGRKLVAHRSVFVKFPLKKQPR